MNSENDVKDPYDLQPGDTFGFSVAYSDGDTRLTARKPFNLKQELIAFTQAHAVANRSADSGMDLFMSSLIQRGLASMLTINTWISLDVDAYTIPFSRLDAESLSPDKELGFHPVGDVPRYSYLQATLDESIEGRPTYILNGETYPEPFVLIDQINALNYIFFALEEEAIRVVDHLNRQWIDHENKVEVDPNILYTYQPDDSETSHAPEAYQSLERTSTLFSPTGEALAMFNPALVALFELVSLLNCNANRIRYREAAKGAEPCDSPA